MTQHSQVLANMANRPMNARLRLVCRTSALALAALSLMTGCGDAGDGLGQTGATGATTQALETPWAASTAYAVDDLVLYGGVVYECLQAHTSQTGWEPPNAPALWKLPSQPGTNPWAASTSYSAGDRVTYEGSIYEAIQGHTSQVGWEPPNTPALWQRLSVGLQLDAPVAGDSGSDWVVNNYFDQDPTSGVLDYTGGSRSYNGHYAIDIDISTFRDMDAGVQVLAAAGGEVVFIREDQFDRNVSCSGVANSVEIHTPEGFVMRYLHLKKDSVSPFIEQGEIVEAGQPIGLVGSSGCSTQPHLHFALFGPTGNVIDPFEQGMWKDPPAYSSAPTVMDFMLTDQPLIGNDIKDPPANLTVVPTGSELTVGLSVANGRSGDSVGGVLRRPDNSVHSNFNINFNAVSGHTYWVSPEYSISGPTGNWTLEILENGSVAESHPFQVTSN